MPPCRAGLRHRPGCSGRWLGGISRQCHLLQRPIHRHRFRADIWGTADAFHFVYVYVPVSTNCDIRARVVSVQNTAGNAKAAVMIRETLATGSRQATADVEPSSGLEFLYRASTGGSTSPPPLAGGRQTGFA